MAHSKRPQSFLQPEVEVTPTLAAATPKKKERMWLVCKSTSIYSWCSTEADAQQHYDECREQGFARIVATPYRSENEEVWRAFLQRLSDEFEARKEVVRERTNTPLTHTLADHGLAEIMAQYKQFANFKPTIDAYQEGMSARKLGALETDNPYKTVTNPSDYAKKMKWLRGYRGEAR